MAKNENKSDLNANQDMIDAPEKTAEVAQPEQVETLPNPKKKDAKEAPKKPEPPHKEPKPAEPPHKKHHGGRKFMFVIFLLLLGGVAALAMQLEQTKKLNAESLQQMQAAYDAKLEAFDARVKGLNREVTALKERPIVEKAAGISENQLNQKITALREEMLSYLTQQAPETETKNADETAENTDTAEKQALLASEFSALAAGEKKTQEVLLASGAIIVRDLAEQGISFAYEAEVLQILARGNELAEDYVRVMRNFANTGIVGKHQLIRSFDKIFAELNEARTKVSTEPVKKVETRHWYNSAWEWVKQSIMVRKIEKKPVFTAQNDEVFDLVHEGRLQDALNALKTSEKYSKIDSKPLNVWKEQTERYLEFSNAAGGLIMNALANIRLKELEHAAE